MIPRPLLTSQNLETFPEECCILQRNRRAKTTFRKKWETHFVHFVIPPFTWIRGKEQCTLRSRQLTNWSQSTLYRRQIITARSVILCVEKCAISPHIWTSPSVPAVVQGIIMTYSSVNIDKIQVFEKWIVCFCLAINNILTVIQL